MGQRNSACLLLFASVSLAATATSASAQTPPAPTASATTVGEIIVTAQRRNERLRDVPITITSTTGDQLQRAGVRDLMDLQSVVPGVRVDLAGNYVQPAIRGVSASVIGASTDAPVAIYLDGVYQPDQLANHFQFADVARIEVDKGPQGTLYGREATGGAIAIFTRSPSFTPTGDFEIGYGKFNDFLAKGFVTGPVIGDVLAGSVSAYYERRDDYNYDVARHLRPPGMDAKNFRVKLLYQPTSRFQATLALYYQNWIDSDAGDAIPWHGNTVDAQDPNAIITTKPHTIAFNTPTFLHTKDTSATLNMQYDLGFGTLTSISDLSYGWNHLVFDEDRGYSLLNGLAYDNVSKDHHSSEDLSFSSRKFGGFSFIAGASYFFDDNKYQPQLVRGGPPMPGSPLSPVTSLFVDHNPVRSYAAFGEGTLDVTDRLTLVGGARYTWEHRGNDGFIYVPAFNLTLTGPPVASTFDAVTFRASARYKLTDTTNTYFSFSQGFKSGGQDAAGFLMNHPNYQPEKINAYEVGVKSNPTTTFAVNASVFYYDYTNLQVQVNNGGVNGNFIQNAATARLYGLDLDATARLTDEFTLTAALNLLHAHYVTFPNAAVEFPLPLVNGKPNGNSTIVLPSLAGYQMPRAPNATFSTTADYKKVFSAGTFDLNGTVYYTSRIYFDSNERISQPAYAALAMQASFQPAGSRFRFQVWGKNLTNTTYISSVYEDGPADGVNYAARTSYGVGLRYSF